MADKWFIHTQEAPQIGPFTAVEIRGFLREGKIDPFDLVSKVGSPLKRQLVEVDEIFLSSKVVLEAVSDKTLAGETLEPRQSPMAQPPGSPLGEATYIAHQGPFAPPQMPAPQIPPMAAPAAPQPQPAPRPTPEGQHAVLVGRAIRNPRRFHLTDRKGRTFGPISADDIMMLWYRGALGKWSGVKKESGGTPLKLERFVEVYQNARLAAVGKGAPKKPVPQAYASQVPRGLVPKRRVLVFQSVESPGMLLLSLLFMILSLAIGASVVYRHHQMSAAAPTSAKKIHSPVKPPVKKLEKSPKNKVSSQP